MTVRCWLKLSIHCPAAIAEEVAALLGSFGDGVEQGYHPGGAASDQESVTVYLEQNPETDATLQTIKELLSALRRQLPADAPWRVEHEVIADRDWNATWKKHFTPFLVAPELIIKPSWSEYTPRPGERVIEMDPGMAFGTGHHASTRLALLLLRDLYGEQPPATVLDVGCGTGILAMAAALWGCPRVVAMDNDPQAVAVARQNFAANQLAIAATTTPPAALAEQFEVVLANIIHEVLWEMATELVAALKPGGHLILAGILSGTQEASIKQHFQDLGLQPLASPHREEWAAWLLRKPATEPPAPNNLE